MSAETWQQVVFWVFAVVITIAAVRVVTTRNVIHAALWLVGALMGAAAMYVLLFAEFVAWVQVLVYVGAIVVLMLFGLMLTRAPIGSAEFDNNQRPLAAICALAVFAVISVILVTAFEGREINFARAAGTTTESIGTAIFSVPLGIAAAIYLSEYASDTPLTRTIRIAIINLAGIPSVVYGLFGLGLFVLFLNFGTSILAASLTLSIMTLPVIISTAEESLRSVPQAFRTVSISLGATGWQTIRRIVLKEALPGILTGVILGLERAAGETAPILFTGAAFFLPRLPHSPFDATMALPYHLFVISTQVPEMPIKIQYGTALVLLVFVLTMNLIATVIRSRARAKRQW